MARHDRPGAWLLVPLILILSGCAAHEAAPPDAGEQAAARRLSAIEQRLAEIERRLLRLESLPPVEAPYGNRDDVQNQIGQLETERGKLLLNYTEQHPAVRTLDRKLLILREQLRMLAP